MVLFARTGRSLAVFRRASHRVAAYLGRRSKWLKLAVALRFLDASRGTSETPADRLAEATPVNLTWDPARRLWIGAARDPQFVFSRPFAAGFYQVRVEGRLTRFPNALARELRTELYVDYGGGFSRADSLAYRIDGGRIAVDDIVVLPRRARALRLDPVNVEADLEMTALAFAPAPLGHVAARLREAHAAAGRTAESFLKDHRWPGQVRAALRRMSPALARGTESYRDWIEATAMTPARRTALEAKAAAKPSRPKISIVMPTYNADPRFLERAVDSVMAQIYPDWQLCLVEDGSPDPAARDFGRAQGLRDRRIAFRALPQNAGIAAASNAALEMAQGEFVAFLDHDDELAPQALLKIAEAVATHADVDMIYSDEDKIDADGVRSDPLFKPDWSPETMLGCMYTCHLSAYRTALVRELGGLRCAFDLAQDYDLALRVSRRARSIVHIPDVLYHWRTLPSSTASSSQAKPTAELAARRAIQDHLDANGMAGAALPGPFPGSHRIRLEVIGEPLVSIVIPTAARRIVPDKKRWYVLDVLRSILSTSTYENYEIVLVENGDMEPSLQAELKGLPVSTVLYAGKQFNYSEKVNLGVAAANGEHIILLNDDMVVITPEWIEELVSWLQRPGVVATGAKLLFPDTTVQHAGILMLGQGPSHVYYGERENYPGQFGGALLLRNYSGVTAACLAFKRRDFEAVSGFDPSFRVNYNDVDFCLRLSRLGRIVYVPDVKLFHFESVSRDDSPPAELAAINAKWADVIGYDPYYNANLSQFTPYEVVAPVPEEAAAAM